MDKEIMNKTDSVSLTPVVGMTVYYKPLFTRNGDDTELKETKITKVGKKYIEIEGQGRCTGRFHKDSLTEDSGEYIPQYKLYLTKEQYEIEVETNLIRKELVGCFQWHSKIELSIEKLREILSIVRS
jgi:hypothetical protein